MSIEKLLEDLTDAIRENTETQKTFLAAAKGRTSEGGKAAVKDEDEEKPKRTRTAKVKVPTSKELGTKTSAFLEVEDEDEYENRKSIIKKIVSKFDAAKMSEIEEDNRLEAMELLDIAISGKDPFKKARSRDDDDVA